MADQLNMGGLSLDSQRPNGVGGGRSAYIPPHMRSVQGKMESGPPPMMNGAPGYDRSSDEIEREGH